MIISRLIKTFPVAFIFSVFFSSAVVCAEPQHDFSTWLAAFKTEAMAQGISEKTLNEAFQHVRPLERIIELDRNQPEFKQSLDQYLSRVVTDKRVMRGKEKLKQKEKTLWTIYQRYKVPPRFLVALWGIETNFGDITGNIPVVASLATLAYDPRRSGYFRKELIHALHIIDNGFIPLEKLNGSWAGAFGQLQFMPSTFRGNAVDFNNDGKIEIWDDGVDLFASGANYLANSGWQAGLTWGRQVLLPQDFPKELIDSPTKRTLPALQKLGVRKISGAPLPPENIMARIIQPDGPGGRAFVVYDNFDVILKWNRSYNYAVAVGLLADEIGYQTTQ